MADINLVPQDIKQEQEKVRVVRKTTIFSILLTLVVGIVAGGILFETQSMKSKTAELQDSITSLRANINTLSEIEVLARNLDMRSATVEEVLAERSYYSVLMAEIQKRLPETVVLETLGTNRDSTINLAGTGIDYLSVATFVNNLSDKNFAGAAQGTQNLFTNVSLNSVSLDSQTSRAQFFIVLTIDSGVLRK